MKPINKSARKVMETLTDGLHAENSHRKVGAADGAFMSVVVEFVGQTRMGPTYSVAHYYEQNGDLMADPEMLFLKATTTGDFYPLHFQQDNLGIFRRGYEISADGNSDRTNVREQSDQASFANTWLKNIAYQQGLNRRAA